MDGVELVLGNKACTTSILDQHKLAISFRERDKHLCFMNKLLRLFENAFYFTQKYIEQFMLHLLHLISLELSCKLNVAILNKELEKYSQNLCSIYVRINKEHSAHNARKQIVLYCSANV